MSSENGTSAEELWTQGSSWQRLPGYRNVRGYCAVELATSCDKVAGLLCASQCCFGKHGREEGREGGKRKNLLHNNNV